MRRKSIIIGGGILILIAIVIINILSPSPTIIIDGPPIKGPKFQKEGELVFISKDANDTIQVIDIEIVDTEQAINTGLMYRTELPQNAGMLFIFERMELRSFWMKNTLIPLDILFIDDFNQIVTIQRNTTPKSVKSIPSNKPAKYVLEVDAGYCEQIGVQEGDFVVF